jgi:hypothetical protein
MENEIDMNDPKFRGFVGFIPKPLGLVDSPELSVFPFNVLIGRYTVRDGKQVLGSVLYEPDLSSLILDSENNLVMIYRSRYDSRYFLKLSLDKTYKRRKCEKYKEKELLGTTHGTIDWQKQDESWHNFFRHVAILGLDNGEKCSFS